MTTWDMRFRALPGIPLIQPGDDLPALIAKAAEADGLAFADGDVVVVAQKVVSKAEGRIVRLDDVAPTPEAEELARAHRAGCPAVPALPGRVRGDHRSPGPCTWSPSTGSASSEPAPGWTCPTSPTGPKATRYCCLSIPTLPPAASAPGCAS